MTTLTVSVEILLDGARWLCALPAPETAEHADRRAEFAETLEDRLQIATWLLRWRDATGGAAPQTYRELLRQRAALQTLQREMYALAARLDRAGQDAGA